jgi:DNA-binding MltR family transcriptional regulator
VAGDAAGGVGGAEKVGGNMTDSSHTISEAARNLVDAIAHQRRMTHASIVIAAAAILDSKLERALKRAMQPLSKKLYERLFDGFGPLSSFASKIVMAYALHIVSVQVFQNLEKLRKLRNAFAHSSKILSFGSAEVIPLFRALRIPTATKKPEESFMEFVSVIDGALEEYLAQIGERPS